MQNTEDRFILPSCRPLGSIEHLPLPGVVRYIACTSPASKGIVYVFSDFVWGFSSLVEGNSKIVLKNKIWAIIILYSLDECLCMAEIAKQKTQRMN